MTNPRGSVWPKAIRRIVLVCVLLLSPLLISHPYRWFTNRAIDRRAGELAREFADAEEPITVGALRHCYDNPPVRMFDFGTERGCVTYRAKLMFPRVELVHFPSLGWYAPDYLAAAGSGDPHFRLTGSAESKHDDVDVAYVTRIGTNTPPFDGRWSWESARPEESDGGSYDLFVEKVERSVFTDDVSDSRVSVSDALATGRAPLVIFYRERYCHNVALPLIDALPCFLPG